MMHVVSSRLLRTAFAWDAAASGTLALVQLMQPHLAARLFGLAFELVIGSSVVLLASAALLLWMTSGSTVARTLVRLVIGGNVSWAAGCIALVSMSTAATLLGLVYVLLQAIAAFALAAAQAIGLQRSAGVSAEQVKLALRNTV